MAKIRCVSCGKDVDAGWRFCPHCGSELKGRPARSLRGFGEITPFFDMFDSVSDVFSGADEFFKMPEFDPEDIEKFPKTKFSGIDIRVSNVDGKPDVKVKTFGDFKKYEPEIWKKLGAEPEGQEEKIDKKATEKPEETPEEKPAAEPMLKPGTSYREAKDAVIKRLGDRVIYEFDMPGIRSRDDVRIRKLESSIEIRAIADDKAYFKLLPITLDITGYDVEDGRLTIEFNAG